MMTRPKSPGARTLLAGICFGALVAVIVGYAACYVATHFGAGVVSASGESAGGRAVFSRAAINLYAIQHVTLVGGADHVSATISVPLSLWAIIPGLALILGGWCAASTSGVRSRGAMTACAICAGILYALVLAAASRAVCARIDSFLMPEVSGYGPNPQEFPFRPDAMAALLYPGIFGIIFTYVGGLIAVKRRVAEYMRGKWWACVKSVVAVALIVQMIIIGIGAFKDMASEQKKQDEAAESRQYSVIELIPTAVGIGYSMINGATLSAGVESFIRPTKRTQKAFSAQVNLYTGVVSEKDRKPAPSGVVAAAIVLGSLAAILMGRLAARWGSRDGSLSTAFRVAVIHTAYLALLVAFCSTELITKDAISVSAITVNLCWGLWLLYSFFGVFVLSLIGAGTGARRTAAHLEV